MPYLKSISLHTTVHKALKYILDPGKTESLLYTSSMNCMTNAEDAYLEMKAVYEHYSAKLFQTPMPAHGKADVKAIHYIQAFDPKDHISPELAHRIAKAFARKTFGDDVQVVIATHVDKKHVHNHVIINSYSVSGQKFYANQKTLQRVRQYSDRVCLAFGVKPYDKDQGRGQTIAYNEWEHKKRGTSWKEKIRTDIDELVAHVRNLDELLYELELRGYEVRKGKYISLKAPGQQRAVRTKTLGEDYTAESLASRILWRDVGAGAALHDYEPSQLRDAYQSVIGEVMRLAADGKKIQRRKNSTVPYSPQNDLDVYKLSAQLTIINRDRLHSIGELEGKIETLKASYETALQEVNTLTVQYEKLTSMLRQAEVYFALKDKQHLSAAEQTKLNMCSVTMRNNHIQTAADLDYLKGLVRDHEKKVTTLKERFRECQQLYEVYSDIAKTYYEISSGDYISRLVEEERKRQEREQQKKKNTTI